MPATRKRADTGATIPNARLWSYKVRGQDVPADRHGKAWAVRLPADRAAEAIAAGTLNHVLKKSGYTADDGTEVDPVYVDGVTVTDIRVTVDGRQTWYDRHTGQGWAAVFVTPRETVPTPPRPPRRQDAPTAPSRPVTVSTVDPEILAAMPNVTPSQAAAIAAILGGGVE